VLHAGVFRRVDGCECLPGFLPAGLPGVGHQEYAVCSGKRGFQRFGAIKIRCNDFIRQLRMLGRIACQRAYLELTAGLQRANNGAALLTGCADDSDKLLGVRHGCSPMSGYRWTTQWASDAYL